MKTFFIALRALVYMLGFVLFWGWIAVRVRSWDQGFGILIPAWAGTLGILFMLAGGTVILICMATFIGWGRGTPAPFDAPKEFVAVGLYNYVRNPMYIGALILLIGFGLYQHSISILFLSFVWFLFINLFVLFYEEPNLREKFGATYETYYKAVPRWIPNARRARRTG